MNSMVSGLHLKFEMHRSVNCVLTNGFLLIFSFCSDEETRQASPEVVEVPHRKGPKQKLGQKHPSRE